MAVIDKSLFIRQIQAREEMYVIFSAATNMPLVVCDPDTFDDQVWIFENEEQLQRFAKSYTEQKILTRGVKFLNKDFLAFFSSLHLIGVNQLVFDDGENSAPMRLELTELVNPPDYSKYKPEARPVINPNLQLTGLYFMQEASRQVDNSEKPTVGELEEEFASNLVRARYLIPVILENGPGTVAEKLRNRKFKPPLLKNKQGDLLQPIFTDQMELQKFAKGQKMLAMTVPFAALEKGMAKGVKAYMLNPAGFHVLLTPQLLQALPKRFPQLMQENAGKK